MNEKKSMKNRLVIINGYPGDVAKAYASYYSVQPNTRCVCTTRREGLDKKYLKTDLLDKNRTADIINSLDFKGIEEILLIHPVGQFKFEDETHKIIDTNCDGIDDEVWASNIETFQNTIEPLIERLEGRKLTICQFGSISDKYAIPYWNSYTESKNELRKRVRELSTHSNIRGIFFNLSSVNTENENKTRPFADKTYWINPEEVVIRSVPYIENNLPYQEPSIYLDSPLYHENWFLDTEDLYQRWVRDMAQEG